MLQGTLTNGSTIHRLLRKKNEYILAWKPKILIKRLILLCLYSNNMHIFYGFSWIFAEKVKPNKMLSFLFVSEVKNRERSRCDEENIFMCRLTNLSPRPCLNLETQLGLLFWMNCINACVLVVTLHYSYARRHHWGNGDSKQELSVSFLTTVSESTINSK